MGAEPFLGVHISDNQQEPAPSAPEASTEPTGSSPEGFEIGNGQKDLGEAQKPEAKDTLLDLDKHERFRWQGREWDRKDFQNGHLMREDYSRKTAELAEARKYVENFDADLARVVKDPSLFTQFKSIYPKSYHSVAQRIMDRMSPQTESAPRDGQQSPNVQGQPDVQKIVQSLLRKEIAPLNEWREQLEAERKEAQVTAKLTEIDVLFDKMKTKYPEANVREVESDAIAAGHQKHKVTPELIERLFKSSHDTFEKRADARNKSRVEEQKKANAKSKDTGPGGGTPGTPPPSMKMRDVRKRLLEKLDGH